MSSKTIIFSLLCLLVGFSCSYLLFGLEKENLTDINNVTEDKVVVPSFSKKENISSSMNGFSAESFNARFKNIENDVFFIQQQLEELTQTLNDTQSASKNKKLSARASTIRSNRAKYSGRSFTIDRLIKGGIDATFAEDLVRRKNAVEIKRLQLNDRATRENYLNTTQYYNELAEIDQTDVNLREELGDEEYDNYLFQSKQSNRIRIMSVMLGSTAEQAGMEKNDIVQSYDNKRVFSWHELKQATSEGELGEYTTIEILRNGEVFSYSVLRGTLGIQMGSTRLAP